MGRLWSRCAAAFQHFVVAPPWSARWRWQQAHEVVSRSDEPRPGIGAAHAAAVVASVVALVVAVLVKLDRMGPLAGLNFQPRPHPIAPLQRVTAEWPLDAGWSSLSKARARFTAVMGPESLEFDSDGVGPYTGVADGRVIRWKDGKWETFAIVSPTWDESCTTQLSPRSEKARRKEEQRCGRPLGLKFDKTSGRLYIADAYLGLHSVGPEGGRAVPLVKDLESEVLFANDLDVHPNGSIFFTDSSRRWRRQQYVMLFLEGDDTGRLLRHDPASGATQVVLSGLNFPNGVAVSRDGSFLLLAETVNARLLRVPLAPAVPEAVEVVADLAGYPDNIRRNDEGQFWVAINGPRTAVQEASSRSVWLKKLLFKLPLPLKACLWLFRPWPRPYPTAALVEAGAQGRARVVRVLEERSGSVIKSVSEVQERDGRLWMGSVAHNQIATLDLHLLHSLHLS